MLLHIIVIKITCGGIKTKRKLWKEFAVPITVAFVLMAGLHCISPDQYRVAPTIALGSEVKTKYASWGGEDTVAESPKQIALTFDDGPHPVYTPRLLEGLRERNIQASFFLIGNSIVGKEEIIKQMQEDGHLIGNHSQTHTQLTGEAAAKACEEIYRTNEKIHEITGEYPTYIRPPFGSWSEELECLVPMTVVLWNVDPLDWKIQNKDRIVRHVAKRAEEGSIILLHDVYGTSVEAALEIIDTLSQQGYNFVTVDELLID